MTRTAQTCFPNNRLDRKFKGGRGKVGIGAEEVSLIICSIDYERFSVGHLKEAACKFSKRLSKILQSISPLTTAARRIIARDLSTREEPGHRNR